MGKTYIDTVKYVIHATMEIDGVVEKPDIIGAVFGQTEGLLGEELDLRELQKSGRIGRIEVDTEIKDNKSIGKITIPSSLDKVETAILGAAIETVDRVGPCEAKIRLDKIDDTRTSKREQVVGRAQDILKQMMAETTERKEISDNVRDQTRIGELVEYGPEKIAAGPEIEQNDELIIVEGRADVISLLKSGIKNVISLQGKNIPPSVVELARQKTATLFVDGDRGGDLIAKQFATMDVIDFVAKAPDGKEVEELINKEIFKCLKHKIPIEEFIQLNAAPFYQRSTSMEMERRPMRPRQDTRRGMRPMRREREYMPRSENSYYRREPMVQVQNNDPLVNKLRELEGSLKAVLLNDKNEQIAETDVRHLITEMEKQENANAVIFDGIITQRIVDVAKNKNIKCLVGIKKGRLTSEGDVRILTVS